MRRQAPIYDPLNDEHRSAEWEIELAEMKGTDKLAQAVNEYHAELFEDQKEWMQEKQDTEWWLLGDSVFIDENGFLADICFSNGYRRVHMLIDRNVHNKRYSVVEVYDAQDAMDFTVGSTKQKQTKRESYY